MLIHILDTVHHKFWLDALCMLCYVYVAWYSLTNQTSDVVLTRNTLRVPKILKGYGAVIFRCE